MTHRCSLPLPNNDFLIDTDQERLYSTALSTTVPMKFLGIPDAREIEFHRENGHSPNCVICRDEKDARIRALFYELESCDKMQRILEIQEALKEYGVEIVDQREMELLDLYADGRRMHKAGAL